MLDVTDLSVAYGGLRALSGVSLRVAEGQFVAVVGPNGAGKTTLFKAIAGIVRPDGGGHCFAGNDLLRQPASARAHLGIAHVPEGRQVFKTLTVRENLEMGAYPGPAVQRGSTRWDVSTRCSRSWPSAPASLPARCRAASSRCWRSGAALPPRRGC